MMKSITTTIKLKDPSLDSNPLLFQSLGYIVTDIKPDIDYFSIHVINNIFDNNQDRVGPLIFGSLEYFSRLLTNSKKFKKSNAYFLNLQSSYEASNSYIVEIDYIKTHNDFIYLEAYCYDLEDRLVGKGGCMLVNS